MFTEDLYLITLLNKPILRPERADRGWGAHSAAWMECALFCLHHTVVVYLRPKVGYVGIPLCLAELITP